MRYIVTADEMKEYDNNTIGRIGIPALVLMERAALAVRDVIMENCSEPGKALIVAGTGNNGADGLALARLLSEVGWQAEVCAIGNPERGTEQYKQQTEILVHYPVKLWNGEVAAQRLREISKEAPQDFEVIVDAIFGVGLSRAVTGEFGEAIEAMNALQGFKVAVDIPSGICADTGKVLGIAFRADQTVTFGFRKLGLCLYPGADYAGQIHVADIGITERAFFGHLPKVFSYEEAPEVLLPKRRGDGNKGTFGKVLVIAGFGQMIGAAILCARAALELGAGMVKVLCPMENRAILQTAVPEVLYGTCEDLESSLKWADVVAIGPGLGKSKQAESVLEQVLRQADLPLVIDADALNLLSESEEKRILLREYPGRKVLTPHVGELARLCGLSVSEVKEQFSEVAKRLSKEYHSIMVCKDARTLVADESEQLYLNLSGNNGMATAGSGDVLTGMIASVLGQQGGKADAFAAATVGVYLHGLAGDAAREHYTEYGVTASKVVENIRSLHPQEQLPM